jgi:Fe-S-cluster containining protein
MSDRIPGFACKKGCHDCCGLVPFTAAEKDRAAAIRPLEQWEPFGDTAFVTRSALATMTCPFVTADGCGIYNDRPMICRLFGAVDAPMLTCPHGCGPARKMTDVAARRMLEATP